MPDVRTLNKPCPSGEVWAEVASGAIAGAEAERLLLHAAECNNCAGALRNALAATSAAPSGAHPEVEEEGMADPDLAPLARRIAGRHRLRAGYYYAAAAIAALLLVAAVLRIRDTRGRPPLGALAAAYTSNRVFELRIPGALYGEIQRGPRGDSLDPVETEIRDFLGKHPDNPVWLHAYGRACLLRWKPDEAIRSFQAAADHGASSASFWIDFATAWYERGAASRESSGRDFERALEYLQRALDLEPRNAAALFNRGIVNAQLNRIDPAIRDFEESLRAEPAGRWADEARGRLGALRGGGRR